MATVKTILRKTHQEAVIKVAGAGAAETISLSADLLPVGTQLTDVGTISVSTSSTAVTGTLTAFAAKYVGAELYTTAGVFIGVIATYTSPTSVTLAANAAVTYNNTFKTSFRTQLLDGSTQAANIVGVSWTGATGGIVTIVRNSVTVMTLQADAAGNLDFSGQMMIPDTISNTSDLVVTISGAQAECWLRLRKISGYKTTIQPEQYGSYDDPTVATS